MKEQSKLKRNKGGCYSFRKVRRAMSADDYETWQISDVSNTINLFDLGDVRSTTIVVYEATNSFGIESESRNDNG